MDERNKHFDKKAMVPNDESHAYVLRLRFDTPQDIASMRIRLEDVSAEETWNFKDVASALTRMRQRIDNVIAGRTG